MAFDVQELSTDGVTGPSRVISVDEAAYARVAIEQHFATGSVGGAPSLAGWHTRFDWAHRMASSPAIVETISGVLGSRCEIVASELWIKSPHSKVVVPWHQDETFWPLPDGRIYSVWIALTESSVANGGLCFVRRSHTRVWPHYAVDASVGGLDRGIPDQWFAREAIWAPHIAPGEAMMFTGHTVHGSPESYSGGIRIGFAVRYSLPKETADARSARQ
jgi:non-heme Fe2+,alpha-ketoglutarate-dependent halogenase